VLLRIAIGWHFLYEGLEKVESTHRGNKPFTAEPYLRNATGPLAPYFRGLVPDVNSLDMLESGPLKATWAADVDRIANHYGFDQGQREKAAALLKEADDYADIWLSDRENEEQKEKYYSGLRAVLAIERKTGAMSYERERAAAQRKDLDSDRKTLIAGLVARRDQLKAKVTELATAEQREAKGPVAPLWTSLDTINALTMYGLVAMGLCLMLGLFGPLAALAGAVFLGQIYLSMPPWPGLPPSPVAEGHYLIVNKNLIEMLACLALVFIPTSFWIGLDSLVLGRFTRRREAIDEGIAHRTSPGGNTNTGSGRSAGVDVKPIPLSKGPRERE
jgi:uncharacterized membrane protein YphA (DoxX/SURF4 family)